ncbi:hypothetical protein ACFCXT_26020 [Streptomyces vinaceus]|uniref:hypothetical protein n=1 Tax=Streptomyces vinaceus TaxID=1960 RepID=UPI0035DCCFC9
MPPGIEFKAYLDVVEDGRTALIADWIVCDPEANGWIIQEVWGQNFCYSNAEAGEVKESHVWEAWRVQGGQLLDACQQEWTDRHDVWPAPPTFGTEGTQGQFSFSGVVYWAEDLTPDSEGFMVDGRRWISTGGPLGQLFNVATREWGDSWSKGYIEAVHGEDLDRALMQRKPDPDLEDVPDYHPGNKFDVTAVESAGARDWAVTANLSGRDFYHGTTTDNGEQIRLGGFSLDVTQANGSHQGPGVYLTSDSEEAAGYAYGVGAIVIARYIGVKPAVKVHLNRGSWGDVDKMEKYASNRTIENRTEIMDRRSRDLSGMAQEEGYGALYIYPEKHLLVFNPKDVRVVKVVNLEDLQ